MRLNANRALTSFALIWFVAVSVSAAACTGTEYVAYVLLPGRQVAMMLIIQALHK